MISTGDRCAVKSQSRNQDETEKQLIGSAFEGRPIVALDNCRTTLEGDFLCQLIERPLLGLRSLGKSDIHRIPNTFTMFANGNNVGVADDMVRRTIRCAMDANVENPEKREFKASPLALIQTDRGKYVRACLVIARAYIAADRPNKLTPLPSFEAWSAFVREPLVWLGCADPVDSMEALRLEDPVSNDRYQVFDALKSAIGTGERRKAYTSEIIDVAVGKGDIPGNTVLREALLVIASPRFGTTIEPKLLGKWLATHEKTIAAKCKLMVDRNDKSRPKWYLEPQGT
jgi:putative DNA primase/helicase